MVSVRRWRLRTPRTRLRYTHLKLAQTLKGGSLGQKLIDRTMHLYRISYFFGVPLKISQGDLARCDNI
jgi:hypothetical protein